MQSTFKTVQQDSQGAPGERKIIHGVAWLSFTQSALSLPSLRCLLVWRRLSRWSFGAPSAGSKIRSFGARRPLGRLAGGLSTQPPPSLLYRRHPRRLVSFAPSVVMAAPASVGVASSSSYQPVRIAIGTYSAFISVDTWRTEWPHTIKTLGKDASKSGTQTRHAADGRLGVADGVGSSLASLGRVCRADTCC